MSNGAGLVIGEFYENKKKESVPPEAKKTVKLLFEKLDDLCCVSIGDVKVTGKVKTYTLERVNDLERLEIELEEISE